MKSAGRHHKPVNNELANWLGEHIEQWKPHLPLIGGGAVIVLVGFVIYLFATSGGDSASAPAWQEYYAAFGEPKVEDALKTVAEKQEKTLAGRWARLTLADQQLRQVTQQLVQSPKEGKATLEKAVKNLTEAADGASDKALLARVNMSLGKASETANKLDDARKYYGLVAKDDPEGTFGKSAVKALKRLDKGSDVPELLAWLDKQELESRPKPTGSPFDMGGGRREPLPERPDLSIPGEMKLDGPSPLGPNPLGPSPLDGLDFKGLPGIEKPKAETPKSTEPAKEAPKTTPAVPTPVKPAVPTPVKPEEKAAEEKPAADEKKAEEK